MFGDKLSIFGKVANICCMPYSEMYNIRTPFPNKTFSFKKQCDYHKYVCSIGECTSNMLTTAVKTEKLVPGTGIFFF